MALRDIKPTRSELINPKRRIVLSERGYKILKMKRDGLNIEFFKVLETAKDSQSELQKKYERAIQMMAFANTVEGAIGVKSAAFSVQEVPDITLASKNIMGVVVPEIESSKVKKSLVDRGYGLLGTTSAIDETASSYEDLVEAIIESAEVETNMKKLLDEMKHSNEDQIAPFDRWIELYNDRIGLFGGIDVNTLCRNNYQDIYREVLDKGTRFRKAARGYGIGSGNSIPEYVPVEGFIAMVEAVREISRREES